MNDIPNTDQPDVLTPTALESSTRAEYVVSIAKPVGGERVKGPSARLAEIGMQSWGTAKRRAWKMRHRLAR